MAAISNCEISEVHKMQLEITIANMPCHHSNCAHKKHLYIFNDNNGFFHLRIRPCTLKYGSVFQPIIQHDKAWDIKTACNDLILQSDLCNFHALQALKDKIMTYPDLKIVINPVITALKSVMRSWHKTVRASMVQSFFNYLTNEIPDYIVSVQSKNSFADYLDKCWFHSAWQTTFTAQTAMLVPEKDRRNPLLLTNNITENQFRLFVQGENANHLNKSIAFQIRTLIDRTLPRHANDTVHDATKLARFKNQVNTSKGKLLNCIMKGLCLVKTRKVSLIPNWAQHGWAFVTSEDKEQSGKDHAYSLNEASETLLSQLNASAAHTFHEVVAQYLPVPVPDEGIYIVNIFLTICTCLDFIHQGQPYFCKHLHAVQATINNCHDHLKLLELYFDTVAKIPSGLSTLFPLNSNICDRAYVFSGINCLLQRSHKATKSEVQQAKKGNLLKLLHDHKKKAAPTFFPGKLPKQHPHKLGFRRKGGAILTRNSDYQLKCPIPANNDP